MSLTYSRLWGTRWRQRRATWRRRPWQRRRASSASSGPPAWWRCQSGSGKSPSCYHAARCSDRSSPHSAASYGGLGLVEGTSGTGDRSETEVSDGRYSPYGKVQTPFNDFLLTFKTVLLKCLDFINPVKRNPFKNTYAIVAFPILWKVCCLKLRLWLLLEDKKNQTKGRQIKGGARGQNSKEREKEKYKWEQTGG